LTKLFIIIILLHNDDDDDNIGMIEKIRLWTLKLLLLLLLDIYSLQELWKLT